MELHIEVPDEELGPIIRQDIWAAVYDKLVAQIQAHRTTLIFVNTRRLVERVAHQLTERLGEGKVGAHHGSLSRKTRLEVEEKLKSGEFPVVVATASLELGIDIGHVDVVCHIGSPRNLAVLLQRVGRSGHWLGAIPKGILYPLTRDDLLQSVAAIRAVRQGQLDKLTVVKKPLDVLAQQMVATVASLESATKGTKETNQRRGEAGSVKKRCGNWFVRPIHTKISPKKNTNRSSKCLAKVWKPGAAGAAPIFIAIVSTACCARGAARA